MADVSAAYNTSPWSTPDFSHSCAGKFRASWGSLHSRHLTPGMRYTDPGALWWSLRFLHKYSLEVWGSQLVGRGAGGWLAQPPPFKQNICRGILYISQEDLSSDLDNAPYVSSSFPALPVLLQTIGSWHHLPNQWLAPSLCLRLYSQGNPNPDPSSLSLQELSTTLFRWPPCICWYLQGW